jgi:cellulose synthase/poly-beta-1,6-N-acetylglucosamine synthase-like glycosyltransferase
MIAAAFLSAHTLAALLFWISAVVLFYTFLGYPILIAIAGRWLRKQTAAAVASETAVVSVALVVFNEEARIERRVENLLASDFPKDRLEIVVVSDGSTDSTVKKIAALANPAVRLIEQPVRMGKSACLNVAVENARGEIIVFTDARQRFAPDAIGRLVEKFGDPTVGAVSGDLQIDPASSGVGGGVDAYWRLEKTIRFHESQLDSCIGCTGAVYAIRRRLFAPIPGDTILDDVVIPVQITLQGHRVIHNPDAVAYDPQPLEPALENVRKTRTLAGNFQMLARHPGWLLPWRNRLWWQLLSHKYLRLAAPLLMALLLVSNAALAGDALYRWFLAAQCVFYGLALAGFIFPSKKIALFSLPAGFVFLNLMTVCGLWRFLRKRSARGWASAGERA